MPAAPLKLTIADYQDASHWYCRLLDPSDNLLADHEVKLNFADPGLQPRELPSQ